MWWLLTEEQQRAAVMWFDFFTLPSTCAHRWAVEASFLLFKTGTTSFAQHTPTGDFMSTAEVIVFSARR